MFWSHQLKGHWFFKYKLYHFLFWGFYFFFWGAIELSLSVAYKAMFFSPRFVIFLFYVMIHTLANQFNLYVLLPRYLYKGKVTKYILSLILWIGMVSCTMLGCYFLSAIIIGQPLDYFCVFNEEKGETFFHILTSEILPATSGTLLLGLCIKLAKNSLIAQKQQQLLENEKLTAELKFLKHQFNPHFLFNTINSIFFLIHKAPEQASNALAKFSDLLRYQLYECNEQLIPFNQEINYLQNFVALEKLRRSKDFKIDLIINRVNNVLGIAPFILVTFVENAFKHVSDSKKTLNWIEIKAELDIYDCLLFTVANSVSEDRNKFANADNYGGIGLKNVCRRLDLLYPNKYSLEIDHGKTRFIIKLKIELEEFIFKGVINPETKIV